MTEQGPERPVVQFALQSQSASKRPEQLVTLLEDTLRREFPESADVVQVSHSVDDAVVHLLHLDQLEEDAAEKLAHRARAVYNDFMISPWY